MKILTGKVIVSREKLAIIEVERFYAHTLYGKRVRRTKKYHVHDEVGAKAHDVVQFGETRPISKTKRWKIVKIVRKVEEKS